MPLKVVRRKDTGALTISGTVKFADGSRLRVRARAQSGRRDVAEEEAVALEARLLREDWHGERRGTRPFAEAILSYLQSAPRKPMQLKRIRRVMLALGDVLLSQVDQAAINEAAKVMFTRVPPTPQTILRELVTPVLTIMHYAHRQGWCDLPVFERPEKPQSKTAYLLPVQAHRLINAAAPHLQPLLTFLLCTGARLSEAVELEWSEVDLEGARAIFWRTKSGKRRVVQLRPAAVSALRMLAASAPKDADSSPIGPVFLYQRHAKARRQAYKDRNREYGGQIKTAWRGARERAGLPRHLTPHDLRHTWASWHYAVHKDPFLLKVEGGWSSVALVEVYAHLLPSGHEEAIKMFWAGPDTLVTRTPTKMPLNGWDKTQKVG
jgi:integrase